VNWIAKTADILLEPADVLICSANVFLNLSGGVGGEILSRHGDAMQRELHGYLAEKKLRFVDRGDVVRTLPHGLPCKAVLHAVAVNSFYETSEVAVRDIVEKSLSLAGAFGARTVTLAALATGFGRLRMPQFAAAIAPLTGREFPPIGRVTICVRLEDDRDALAAVVTASSRCG
jgi:O-acetyl-ADP-ribose deacetylase (regulator of RNase III)